MQLYLMRHGLAGEHGDPAWPDDSQRPLTDLGRRKSRQCARGLRRLGVRLDRLLTSTYVRARQTADAVVAGMKLDTDVLRESVALTPGATYEALLEELGKQQATASVMLVGHEPDLSRLISRLLTADAAAVSVMMKKAAVCRIDVERLTPETRGTLVWLLHPRHLRTAATAD